MKLTLLLEVLKTLERRERDTLSDSEFVMQKARRNADALGYAHRIIDGSATVDLMTSEAEPVLTIRQSSSWSSPLFERGHVGVCTRQHNCAASTEPCNGYAKSTTL